MLFNEFGSRENPTLLCMHGMMQDWRSEYELLKPLEEHFRLIVPAMDGFYDDCSVFTSFADQARQIEAFVQANYGGKLHGLYGASQGGLMVVELLSRNKIEVETAITDGVYVAHQGWLSGWVTYKMFCAIQKRNGKLPKPMIIMAKLMGQTMEDMQDAMEDIYIEAKPISIKRNFLENYTYHTRPELANTKTKVYMWCGSKEPYALKSQKIMKKYLKNYEEEIMEGLGHGEFLMKHREENCKKIWKTLGK